MENLDIKKLFLVFESNYGSLMFHNDGEATKIIAICETIEQARKIFLKQVVKDLEDGFSIDSSFKGKLQDTDSIRIIDYLDSDSWDGYSEITIKELELVKE